VKTTSASHPRARSSRLASLLLSLVSVWGAALLPSTAHADESGTQGRIVRLAVNNQGGDDFASLHGSISVRAGKKVEVYKWGGTSCPAAKLNEAELQALGAAFHNRTRTLIVPRFKSGEVAGTRCLVGFELTAG
jgi:hypothetical protein